MALTIANVIYDTSGSQRKVTARITLDSSYPTGGYTLSATSFAMQRFTNIIAGGSDGYSIDFGSFALQPQTVLMPVYSGAAGTTGATSGGTPAGTNGTSAVTGTGTFTGTASTAAVTTAFSGTGQSSAGQVITTTDNQTMTLNQCANMWFVSATHGPYLIASNTAVTGAPAVLTVIGDAPTTDAGAYVIVKSPTPVGTVSALSGTAAAQTFTGSALSTHTHSVGAAGGAEVANGTNLSAVSFEIEVYGY